jgi:hypothetical protein
MRRSSLLLCLLSGFCASAVADPPHSAAPRWESIVRESNRVLAFYVDPDAFGSWVRGTEPGNPLGTVEAALREGDGTYMGNVVLEGEDRRARELVLASTPLAAETPRPIQPTVALLFERGADRVVTLLDLAAQSLCLIEGEPGGRTQRTLPLKPRELQRIASALVLTGPDHEEVLAAPRRVGADLRAALEDPEAMTLFALHDGAWDAALARARTTDTPGFTAALAALGDPATVRGQATLLRTRARSRVGQGLLDALTRPVELHFMCWDPHHAVHVRRGETQAIFVLCGDCDKASVFVHGRAGSDGRQPFQGGRVLGDMDDILVLHGVARLPPLQERIRARQAARDAPPGEVPAPK